MKTMRRVVFMQLNEKTYEIRSYVVRDDKKFARLLNCINLESIEGRELLEKVAVQFKVLESETTISSISNIWRINC